MSIFNRIFGVPDEIFGSRARAWVAKEKERVKNADILTCREMFVWSIAFISHYGSPNPNRKNSSPASLLLEDTEKKYAGDSTLVEIGCFMHAFVLALMQHSNHPKYGEYRGQYETAFVNLFQELRGWDGLTGIFRSRVNGFSPFMTEAGIDNETYIDHLKELVLRSADNHPPTAYDFSTDQIIRPHSIIDASIVEGRLSSWIECSLSKYIETIRDLYN